ncbi:transmembrane anchor protein [Chromatiales bacterium (ex Bugula neritina AB1)]|nr:transmembrane anchor protein [Chromatiales bacterium (ex Bugula neritina AB1)]
MFSIEKPGLDELPSLAQLRRSSVVAVIGAVLILVAVVLPAEYGIDPTSAGRMLGLTEMGEIKQELHDEAERDQQQHGNDQSFNLIEGIIDVFFSTAHAQEVWRDTITLTLEPGDYTEIKLVMGNGDQALYDWTSTGGKINFDLHAHGSGQSITYEKGRGATKGNGTIKAEFQGEHGWFWRNRDKSAVTLMLKLKGDYGKIIRGK